MAFAATLAMRSRAAASHCWHRDSVTAINDGLPPSVSTDTGHPRLSWWDHKGTCEWADLSFPRPTVVSVVRVFWFSDRPVGGGCDVPLGWRVLYHDGREWRSVENAHAYGVAVDRYNEVTFEPVRASALRIEVQLKPDWSAGIVECQVE